MTEKPEKKKEVVSKPKVKKVETGFGKYGPPIFFLTNHKKVV